MTLSQIKFDINDVIKLVVLVVTVIGVRNDLVNEIRGNKTFDSADKQIINYRLQELETCCNIYAIKPKELTVPTYRVN